MLSRFKRVPYFVLRRYYSSKENPENLKSENQIHSRNSTEFIALEDNESGDAKLGFITTSNSCSSQKPRIDFKDLKHESKVPADPVPYLFTEKPRRTCATPKIDKELLKLLERLSLVSLETKEALQNLEESIEFAEKVLAIPTTGVEPMHTVLEDTILKTRPDEVTDGNIKDAILANAHVTEEDYFVAPPGNIPVEQKDKPFMK